jgi:hypothetical protein
MVTHRARYRDDGYGVFKRARNVFSSAPGENLSVAEKSHFNARGVAPRANSPGNRWREGGAVH